MTRVPSLCSRTLLLYTRKHTSAVEPPTGERVNILLHCIPCELNQFHPDLGRTREAMHPATAAILRHTHRSSGHQNLLVEPGLARRSQLALRLSRHLLEGDVRGQRLNCNTTQVSYTWHGEVHRKSKIPPMKLLLVLVHSTVERSFAKKLLLGRPPKFWHA